MKFEAVMFDLDGTLLPMDQDKFVKYYFGGLCKKIAPLGYEPDALIKALWKGVAAMTRNDGSRLNEEAFWEVFAEELGEGILAYKEDFDGFYRNEFICAKAACEPKPVMKEIVRAARACAERVILATNPIFPLVATQSRIEWAGLAAGDFDFITTYENSRFCKPDPKYFSELAEKFSLTPARCLMVGNDLAEDMQAAREAGFRVLLMKDCMIGHGLDASAYNGGSADDILAYLTNISC